MSEIDEDTFSCALSKEILVHGRMYLSERHICFNANILGWITNLELPFQEVVSIEKRFTAFVIPNAIQISTFHQKYCFASFLWRDGVYIKLVASWRKAMWPHLRSAEIKDSEDIFVDEQGYMEVSEKSNLDSPVNHAAYRPESLNTGSDKIQTPLLPCGCDFHYENTIFTKNLCVSFSTVKEGLFEESCEIWKKTFEELLCTDCSFSNFPWTEKKMIMRRKFTCKMSLPQVILGNGQACAVFKEMVVYNKPGKITVVETEVVLSGIPGGVCRIHARQCLVSQDFLSCLFTVTADAIAPSEAWFRESIRQALLEKARELFSQLSENILPLASTKTDYGSIKSNRRKHFRASILIGLLPLFVIILLSLLTSTIQKKPGSKKSSDAPLEHLRDTKIHKVYQDHSEFLRRHQNFQRGMANVLQGFENVQQRLIKLLSMPQNKNTKKDA